MYSANSLKDIKRVHHFQFYIKIILYHSVFNYTSSLFSIFKGFVLYSTISKIVLYPVVL